MVIENKKVVQGIIVAGHQVASGRGLTTPYPDSALKLQAPHFLARGLDISVYYLGTLNVSIAPYQIEQVNGRYRFEHIEWTHLHPPETFSFSPCELTYNQETYNGLVYYPHPETKLAHFQNPSILEILTTKIAHIQYGSRVQVGLNLQEIVIVSS
ncbi:MAG: hypothetical protein KDE51_16440 [Anaerolineales bacterium]|nr:hypothetical protein [Anaerolineales bacterium]